MKEHSCRFKIDTITCSKLLSMATYDVVLCAGVSILMKAQVAWIKSNFYFRILLDTGVARCSGTHL